ncbi:dual specificity protein phosphatase family protein [Halorarius halobius]|uniref:dual specificity protein phosphatase family protein n=1 Tax=Halorarius halobius TaxID=2962671 RepID=UPI0020CD8296|nr:dual specificity protein phosphatase [Halorarius halobius]
MNRVTDDLYVGSRADAADHAALREAGVTFVLRVTGRGPEAGYPDGVTVTAVPMRDGPQNDPVQFGEAVDRLRGALGEETVLVHCAAGTSRSRSVVAAALAAERDIPLADAYERAGATPEEPPHDALIRRAAGYLDGA